MSSNKKKWYNFEAIFALCARMDILPAPARFISDVDVLVQLHSPLHAMGFLIYTLPGLSLMVPYRLEYFLKAPMRPPVDESWPEPVPSSSSSLRIFLASTLPSSTPHWSKELMSQMAPSVKVKCS